MNFAPTDDASSSRRGSSSPRSKMSPASTTRNSEKTSTATSIRTLRLATGLSEDRGLIDTSVAVDLASIDPARFPTEIAVSSLTLAELTAGPHAAGDELTRARRQLTLQHVEAQLEALPFDSDCARAFGRIYVAIDKAGRKLRGGRAIDLMIAATALAHEISLYTLNARDLRGLEDLVDVVDVSA